ncbi:MAG TPA: hypothetical protein VMV47_08365 [Bacteroidales bacterium]|nr:hypothetical protein [Bacteroidales bacterium]
MANVIIGIHGLGNKPPKPLLEHWWKLAVTEGLRNNKYNTVLPEFEMVFWADIIHDKALSESDKDINSLYYIDEEYTEAPANFLVTEHSTRKKLVDFLGKQLNRIFLNDDLTLNYSFITDAIVDKYFKDLEVYYMGNCTSEDGHSCKVNDLIKKRLLKILEEHRNDDIMLISHSMGSIIAYDVLTFSAPHIRINTFITMGSPLGLPVVISKIAAEQRQQGNKDNLMTTPSCIIKNWFNFSDILDKVALNYKLSDDFTENNHGVKPVDFMVVNDYEINGFRNPHKSFGYLRTPEFSKILNDFILAERLTIKQKVMRRIVEYIDKIKSKIPFIFSTKK